MAFRVSAGRSWSVTSKVAPLYLVLCLSICAVSLGIPTNALCVEEGVAEAADSLAGSGETSDDDALSIGGIILRVVIGVVALIVLFVLFICSPMLPAFQSKVDPNKIIEHKGENSGASGKRVLVAYFTKHGTASSIADKIYEVLKAKGFNVDLRFIPNIGEGEDLSGYDSFILGSAVYWAMAKEFVDFMVGRQELLSKRAVAIFSCCLTIQRDTPQNRERVEAYIKSGTQKTPGITPVDSVAFAGKVEMQKLSLPERAFLTFFFAVTPQKGGDHRNFDKIAAWTDQVAAKL